MMGVPIAEDERISLDVVEYDVDVGLIIRRCCTRGGGRAVDVVEFYRRVVDGGGDRLKFQVRVGVE